MIAAYLLLGIGISAGTVGGMVMTLIAGFTIRHWGWRVAYRVIGR